MADFLTAYKTYIVPNEGWYVNNPNDKGGETYGGIARKIFPAWVGWAYIDNVKKTTPTIKWNTRFPVLDGDVQNFYKQQLWDKNYFGQINSQDVANILFDWFVNSGSNAFNTKGTETFGVQEILNRDFKKGLLTDGVTGPKTVAAINSVDAAKLYSIIKDERKKFYDRIVATNPSQEVFYSGWLDRLKKFPDLVTTTSVSIFAIAVLVGIGLYIYYKGNPLSV